MDFKQAERRFQELQTQKQNGELGEQAFRVEVAKLLFRDDQGAFWMIDAVDGTWFCNRGEGWTPCDPRTVSPLVAAEPTRVRARVRRLGLVLGLGITATVLIGLIGVLVWQQWPMAPWNPTPQVATEEGQIEVTIASPADGSQVVAGQEVAIESTIHGLPDLGAIEQVDLVVNDQVVDSQQVRSKIQPQQTSLPLSRPWLPADAGEYEVKVIAYSAEGERLGEASITLLAEEPPTEKLTDTTCLPDATFVTDVTIPPGTAFPPGARMDKVWQVRNSGSCAWGVGYQLVLAEGESLGAPNAVPVPPTAAGNPADLTVTLWAPEEAGSYASVWQLQSPNGVFFGPTLTLEIEVEVLAQESLPPTAPTDLEAVVTEGGKSVRLTWVDQSDNEDAFRIHREDVEASIGLAPANAELFVDERVACGNTYNYAVVAFNAAGASPIGETAEVELPACAPTDEPPSLSLTVVPTQVEASEAFTVTFRASDDTGLTQVTVRGEETGDPSLDVGRTFTCLGVTCLGSWPITPAPGVSGTLTLVARALDTSGQESGPALAMVEVLPSE